MNLTYPIRSIARKVISIFRNKVSVNIIDVNFHQILQDQVVLLTGATGGLGQELARAILKAGARVILCGRDFNKIENQKKQLVAINKTYERSVKILAFDLKNVNEYDSILSKAISFYGHIDSLINNAGSIGASIPNATENDYDNIMTTNLKSTFFLSQIVIKYFRDNKIKGHILNVASSSSLRPAFSAYSISKWGIRGLTLGLAKLGAKYDITVNAIAPGPTATPMLGRSPGEDLTLPFSPIGRLIHPIEIANMAVFLLSESCRSIVGDVIYMTGGAGTITFDDDEITF